MNLGQPFKLQEELQIHTRTQWTIISRSEEVAEDEAEVVVVKRGAKLRSQKRCLTCCATLLKAVSNN
jgi:hypothetical protein